VQSAEHAEGRQHPPRVTHIRQLFWPAIESTWRQLPLTQPPAKSVSIY